MALKPAGNIALTRYLERHIECNLPPCPFTRPENGDDFAPPWQHVLVIPAYRENPDSLQTLAKLQSKRGRIIVLIVLNRPDNENDANCNNALRQALYALPLTKEMPDCVELRALNALTDVYCLDTETSHGALPFKEGVGLARKIGCDTALKWMTEGAIYSRWIHNSDADAHLPPTYFEFADSVAQSNAAIHYPFWHFQQAADVDQKIESATALYELRLHQYVLGLQFAGSPYAFHTLGSCIAVHRDNYAQVRGFPKRAAGEDFYLLNKLAKTGSIYSPPEPVIAIESRASTRVPFGTGPAVEQLSNGGTLQDAEIFYHPICFAALRAVLKSTAIVAEGVFAKNREASSLVDSLCLELSSDLGAKLLLSNTIENTLIAMGIEKTLEHCKRQSTTEKQFLRQFHQWFDGFRTLKFIHAMREAGWPNQSLGSLQNLQPAIWPIPAAEKTTVAGLRKAINAHWNWK